MTKSKFEFESIDQKGNVDVGPQQTTKVMKIMCSLQIKIMNLKAYIFIFPSPPQTLISIHSLPSQDRKPKYPIRPGGWWKAEQLVPANNTCFPHANTTLKIVKNTTTTPSGF
uniref:Ovule protein n=1 Tax=Heterorhabditis bacteriophora TaxID=37862 RepID=A0A1I7WR56_HETBA